MRGADEVSQQATDIEVRAGSLGAELPDVVAAVSAVTQSSASK